MARPRSYAVRKFIYGQVSEEEHARIKALALAASVSMSEWVRRAVNLALSEADEDAKLLEELGERSVKYLGKMRSVHRTDPPVV